MLIFKIMFAIALWVSVPAWSILTITLLLASSNAQKRSALGKSNMRYWMHWSAFALVLVMLIALIEFSNWGKPADQNETPPLDQAKIFVNLGWKNMDSPHPDYTLALRNNQSGYELGHPEGAANIGLLYENGWGVKKNAATAATWYKKAIDMGSFRSAQANYQLARLYEKGLGVDMDLSLAESHYSAALRISAGLEHSNYTDDGQAELARAALRRLKGEE